MTVTCIATRRVLVRTLFCGTTQELPHRGMNLQVLASNALSFEFSTWNAKKPHLTYLSRVQKNGRCLRSPPNFCERNFHSFRSTRACDHVPRGVPDNDDTSKSSPSVPPENKVQNAAPILTHSSRLPSPCPWGWLETVSTLMLYETLIHIPLGLGGLSIASALLGPESIDPQLKAFSLLFFASLELAASWLLLSSSLAPYKPLPPSWFSFWPSAASPRWTLPVSILAGTTATLATVGTGRALLYVGLPTEIHVDASHPPLVSPLLEMLSAGLPAQAATCISVVLIAPVLEEYIYRGFLLPSLASKMPVLLSLVLSSVVFALSHPNSGAWPELVCLGFVLGGVYCWKGNLAAPIGVHMLYNALVFGSLLYSVGSMHDHVEH